MLLIRALLLTVFALLAGPAFAVVAIDGSCATGIATATTTLTATLTTTQTNDVIVLGVNNERTSVQASYAAVSNISGGGLTWHSRKVVQVNGGAGGAWNTSEEWWATSAGTLSAQVITITFSTTIDDSTVAVCAFSGGNVANPFDSNVALPGSGTSIALTQPTANITTSNANTMMLGWAHGPVATAQSAAGTFNLVTGTLASNINNTGGTNNSATSLNYLAVTSTQSANPFLANAAMPTWVAITDAICQSGGSSCTGGSAAATAVNFNGALLGVQ